MPVVRWGVGAEDIDDFDRDSQFKPYAGPVPPDGVYAWNVKVFKHVAGSRDKNPQLRVGLELVPRQGFDEEQYRNYFIMDFLPIASNTRFRYVPLLDALGVSGKDFTSRTKTDEDGNIIQIGRWRNDGSTVVIAQLITEKDQTGNDKKSIRGGTYGDLGQDIELSTSGDSDDSDDSDDMPDDGDWDADPIVDDYEEDDPPARGRSKIRGRTARRATTGRTGTRGRVRGRVQASRKRPADDDDEGF